jgi:TonB-dependent siderophore receptor
MPFQPGCVSLRRRLARAAAALLVPAATALAQGPPPSGADPGAPAADEPPRYRDAVDVEAELPAVPPSTSAATRTPVPVRHLPVSASVVPRSLFESQGASVLGDALRNASGVNVATGFGVFDFFVIRGFDSLTSGLVLVDGVPEPESTFYPLYNVRQVEVVKGPAAFLYGGNPLAGAVQLVRKRPASRRFAELTLAYGRFGAVEGALDANAATADGKGAFRLNGAYQGTDGHREVGDGSIRAVNPAVSWRPAADTRVDVSFEYVRSAWPPDSGLPFFEGALAEVGREQSYQSPFDRSEQDLYRLRLDAEHRVSPRLRLRNRLYYTDLRWDSDGTLLTEAFEVAGPGSPPLVFRTLALLDDRQKLLGDQLEGVLSFATGRVGHELLAGLELSRTTDDFTQDASLLPPMALFTPVETARLPIVTVPQFRQAGDSRTVVFAPYVVDRLTFSPKVQAFAGARFDVLDHDERLSGTRRDDQELSPLLGLLLSPRESLSLYVSAGRAFAPPSTQVVGPREPEESRQVEAGAKKTFLAGKGFAALALYALERQGIAIPDSSGLLRQAGDQRSRGVELEASAEAARGLVLYASYAFTDAVLTRFAETVPAGPLPVVRDRSGNRAPYAPRHLLNVWGSKQLGGGFGLAAGLRVVGRQLTAEDNRNAVGAYGLVDAAVSYRAGRVRAAVNLRNLTGEEYATRGFGGGSAIPGRPFEVHGRVQVLLGSR